MEEKESHITLKLPVRIRYEVLQQYFREELVGEPITKQDEDGKETTYAEVLALSLERSQKETFDLVLHLRLRTLHSFYKNKIFRISLHLAFDFHPGQQHICVREYSLEGKNKNWLTNRFLELLANSFLYRKWKNKMDFELLPIIREQMEKINLLLRNRMEVYQGIRLSGAINQFEVTDFVPAEKYLVISVLLTGNALLDIDKLSL